MIVFVLERASPSLKGHLSRWLLEPHAGVFVGNLSMRVRIRLWKRICDSGKCGGCLMIARTANEQGFAIETHGEPRRQIIDIEGLQLVRTLTRPASK